MLLFIVVAVAVDTSEKTDDFVKSGLSSAQIFKQYYLGFIPHIWGLLFPLFVFISVIFFTSRMAMRSEIIAILASGTSYNRMLRPYIIGGALLAVVLWLGSRYVIPKANILRTEFQTKYLDKNDPTKNIINSSCYNCYYRRIDPNTYVGIRNYDTATKSAPIFFLNRVKGNKQVYNIKASSIQWDTVSKRWKLLNAIVRTIDDTKETSQEYGVLYLKTSLKSSELRRDDYLKDKLTTPELVRYINREKARGAEGLSAMEVERYRRTATSFAVILLAFIGAVAASRKTRGGSGMHIAVGIITASLFILLDRFSTVFAVKSNLHPFVAAWIPNIIFTLVSIWIYIRAPK